MTTSHFFVLLGIALAGATLPGCQITTCEDGSHCAEDPPRRSAEEGKACGADTGGGGQGGDGTDVGGAGSVGGAGGTTADGGAGGAACGAECAAPDECVQGVCKTPCTKSCQCPIGDSCQAGYCGPADPTPARCNDDCDCPSGESCSAGTCS